MHCYAHKPKLTQPLPELSKCTSAFCLTAADFCYFTYVLWLHSTLLIITQKHFSGLYPFCDYDVGQRLEPTLQEPWQQLQQEAEGAQQLGH